MSTNRYDKYLSKVTKRIFKEFNNKSSDIIIDTYVENNMPYLEINLVLGVNLVFSKEYNLAGAYIAYTEDDLSIKQSIKFVLKELEAQINLMNELDDLEEQEEYDDLLTQDMFEEVQNNFLSDITFIPVSKENYERYFKDEYPCINLGDGFALLGKEIKEDNGDYTNRYISYSDLEENEYNLEDIIRLVKTKIKEEKEDFKIFSISSFLNISDNNVPMFVGTTINEYNGAKILFCPDKMKEFSSLLGSENLYVILSSVHDIIVFKQPEEPNEIIPWSQFSMVIKELNNQVESYEVLSDCLYKYDIDANKLEILDNEDLVKLEEESKENYYKNYKTESIELFAKNLLSFLKWKLPEEDLLLDILKDDESNNDYYIISNDSETIEINVNFIKYIYEDKDISFDEIGLALVENILLNKETSLTDMENELSEEEESQMEKIEVLSYSEFVSNLGYFEADIQTVFEDYDTNFDDEFSKEMIQFFRWKEPNEVFNLLKDNNSIYYLSTGDIKINLSEANSIYQNNSQSFLEVGLDLLTDYRQEKRLELLNKFQNDNSKLEEQQEEYDEDYFPF